MKQEKTLNDRMPDFKEFKKLSDQLIAETPRAVAIVGCAYLDNVLNETLKAFLIEDKKLFKNFIDRLTFERRISMCYLLGIIVRQVRDDLKIINKIRGWFAHDVDLNSFDIESVVIECKKLTCLKNGAAKGMMTTDDPRVKYVWAISFYCGRLQVMRKLCERIDIKTLFDVPK